MNEEEFLKEIKDFKISSDITKLNEYYKFLINENNKYNLTSIVNKEEVYLKHFYDSLTILKIIDLNKYKYICDVGSGAGFPGMVLKIFFENLDITLIDSLNKRVVFLNKLKDKLNLDVHVFHERMEMYSKNNEEKFDVILSRAVSNYKIISEISVRALKLNGYIVIMSGKEIKIDEEFLKKLGLKNVKEKHFNLYKNNDERTLYLLKKIKKTPSYIPRNFNKIKEESKNKIN